MLKNIFILLFLFTFCTIQAQTDTLCSDVFFAQGGWRVNANYKGNGAALDSIVSKLRAIEDDRGLRLDRVEIESYASPEGQLRFNLQLAQRRCRATERYIWERVTLPDSLFVTLNNGVAWDRLREMVAGSKMRYRDQVLYIIDNVPPERWSKNIMVDSRNKRLMDLRGGVAYKYMTSHFYPLLRNASVVTITYSTVEGEPRKALEYVINDSVELQRPAIVHSDAIAIPVFTPYFEYKPRFAIKTNLLFDFALLPNIEFEWFFNDRMSINLDYQCAWWKFAERDYFYQIMMVSPEFRYWFKGDGRFRGHFAGAYLGTGYYDLKWEKYGLGYQGELYIALGLSYGYHLAVTERFGVEFSLGLGYMVTQYRKYENMRQYGYYDNTGNHYVYMGSDRTSYLGPTKAKISLVWRLGERKGARR